MNRIRNFLYRSPRVAADCRMDFIQGDSICLGTCTDLSESGLRGIFLGPVATGSEGLLTLYHEERPFQMQARVYSVRDNEARFRVRFTSEEERAAMLSLIKLLAARA